MLSSEFQQEMGALVRSLSQRVRTDPDVRDGDPVEAIDAAIITLIELRLSLQKATAGTE